MAKKLESSLLNMVLCLLILSMVMSAALGYVYVITKGPIEQADRQKELDAIKKVSPAYDNDAASEKKEIDGVTYYPLTSAGNPAGYAVKTYTEKGFSGRFELMVGFKPDGSVNAIEVLVQKETPGLGTKMAEPKFKNQFIGKNLDSFKAIVKKDGGVVDAITASTITSRAFCDALQRAHDGLNKNFGSAKTDSTSIKK